MNLSNLPLVPPNDHLVTDKEFLTQQYNYWREQLIERVSQLKQAELEKKRDPSVTFQNQNNKSFTILDVVEARKGLVREAKQYVEALKQLLDTAENGTLDQIWSDDELKPLPKFKMPTKK